MPRAEHLEGGDPPAATRPAGLGGLGGRRRGRCSAGRVFGGGVGVRRGLVGVLGLHESIIDLGAPAEYRG